MDKSADLKQDENLLAKFLTLPSSTTPEVRRIAALLERKNEKTGFLNEMAKRHGLALWDKAIKRTSKEGAKRMAQRAANISDTIIYIPLALENANHVNAFIFARLHDSIALRFYRENDYVSYGFGTIQDSTNNAEKLAVQFMLLDFETFGHSKFKVLDDSLLKDNTLSAGILTKDRKVHVEHSHSSQQNRGSSFEVWEYEVCTSTRYWECSSNGNCCSRAGVAPGACSACEGCWKTKTTCTKTSILVSVDDGWFPSGGGTPPDNGGGGGPAGSNPTGPTPCNPTPLLDNGLLPCPHGNTTGWLPDLEPLPPTTPCDQVKNVADVSKNPAYMQKVKDLAKPENLNLGYEKSVAHIDGATPDIKEDNGTTTVANVQIPDLPSGQKYKSFAHTHPNTSGGTYSVFSFGDLRRMSMLLHNGQLEADKFVIFMSSYKGTHYALTISDKTKFEKFFYYFNNKGEGPNMFEWFDSFNKADKIERKFFNSKSPLITETDTNNSNVLDKFLDFMNEADLGVALFETTANFDSFTKVEKDQAGTIKRINCN